MGRRRQKSNKRPWIAVIAVLAVLFVGNMAIDQARLFSRYHTEMEEKQAEIRTLEAEISELEQDAKAVESLPFIMKYALKYGMTPTDATPMPVEFPEAADPDTTEENVSH